MITTCDMRHLYAAKPKNETLILQAKEYERRRCNHQDLDEPLSTLECLSEVVDPKHSGTNKNRYIVASNDSRVRGHMRSIAGVPLMYISKSVVLMEPMANATEELREREEKSKFKLGLKGQRKPDQVQKRKRDDDEEGEQDNQSVSEPAKKKKPKGPKQPNPLSMKKAKKDKPDQASAPKKPRTTDADELQPPATDDVGAPGESSGRKRKRKPKSKGDGDAVAVEDDAGSP
jgi:U3 small nucleolar RNA-associated protein 23